MLNRRPGLGLVSLTALAALVVLPAQALARDKADADFASELDNPDNQKAMGDMLGGMLSAMLNLKAAPLARAMERMGDAKAAHRIPHGATLGDLAGPDARRAPEELRRRVPIMMGAMSELSVMMREMAPQLEAMGKDFARKIDKTEAGDKAADESAASEPAVDEAQPAD